LQKLYIGRIFIERVGQERSSPGLHIALDSACPSGPGRSQFYDNSGLLAQAPEKVEKINSALPIAMNRLRLYIPAKFQ
jgi:hypothetical protein